jgi:hypothetical protein
MTLPCSYLYLSPVVYTYMLKCLFKIADFVFYLIPGWQEDVWPLAAYEPIAVGCCCHACLKPLGVCITLSPFLLYSKCYLFLLSFRCFGFGQPTVSSVVNCDGGLMVYSVPILAKAVGRLGVGLVTHHTIWVTFKSTLLKMNLDSLCRVFQRLWGLPGQHSWFAKVCQGR